MTEVTYWPRILNFTSNRVLFIVILDNSFLQVYIILLFVYFRFKS